MKEKVLSNKKKGMFVLLLTILVYLAVIADVLWAVLWSAQGNRRCF